MGWTVAVVQARMGSSRLPGKILADIAGRAMLERVVTSVGRSPEIDEVVVATTTLTEDDRVAALVESLGLRVVRGDSADVLARYVLAARESAADVIVRVTADCPFISAEVVTEVVRSLQSGHGEFDYAANVIAPRTYPLGLDVEAMAAAALFEADRSDLDPGSREHVTPYIRDSGRFRLARINLPEDLSHVRWTVDTPEDLELARRMAEHFGGEIVPWTDLLAAWQQTPEWREINAGVVQKTVTRHLR